MAGRWLASVAAACVMLVAVPEAPAANKKANTASQSKRPVAASARKTAVKKSSPQRVSASRSGNTARAATSRRVSGTISARNHGKTSVVRKAVVSAPRIEARPSFGQAYGLHETADPLDLKSSVALVLDQETNEVLLSKNSQAVLPIASLTKLMTALVVTDAQQSLDDVLTITEADIDTEKGSHSRLAIGTSLTRGEMMHLALMSSENRAANALGRHYPGGLTAFVAAMNRKAHEIGMSDSRFVEPTGLSSRNQSSARDLAILVKAAYQHQLIRDLSTSPEYQVAVGNRNLQYRNTNGLVFNPTWEIGLQKTGYISEAGRCLVMQAQLAGRKLIMVFLDSAGKYSRLGDAERVRKWLIESMTSDAAVPSFPRVTS
jgi:D-alanyl-D-alanine endopeptidase (penicillin-binding protein 7)